MTRAIKEEERRRVPDAEGQLGNYGGQRLPAQWRSRNTANTINPATGNKTEGVHRHCAIGGVPVRPGVLGQLQVRQAGRRR